MNNLYVNNLKIDWSVISEDSYLRKIHSIAKIQKLTFEKPVTIFSGENGSGKLLLFINKMVHKKSQFIIITHSPILLAFPNADICNFSESGIKRISYEDTESYRIMELFINHKDRILDNLFNNSEQE